MAVIEACGLAKAYGGRRVVSDFTMTVSPGDIYGFVGKNGAGKSTVMKMICGEVTATAGEVVLFGGASEGGARRIGVLIEQPGLLPGLTAYENVMAKALAFGLVDAKDRCAEVLRLVGLDGTGRKKAKGFSLGMKQRLGLALALMNHPDFLILDEPINGLDPEGVAEFRQILRTLNRERQTTILISSHILSELANVATRYGFMEQGKILEEISAEALHDKCRICLRLEVDDAARAAAILQTQLGTDKFEVLPGNAIQLYDCLDDPKRASYALAQNGVALLAMEQKGADLEAYFLNLIGGGRHA